MSPKLYLASDSPTFGWLDDLVRNTRSSLQDALLMMREHAPFQKYPAGIPAIKYQTVTYGAEVVS